MELKVDLDILKHNAMLFLLIAGVLMPDGISEIMPSVGAIWGIWRWGCCISIVLYWLYLAAIHGQLTISIPTMIFVGFFAYIAVITVIMKASIVYMLSTYLPIITSLFMYEICKDDLLSYFRVVEAYLIVLAIINLFLLILYPDGMYVSASLMGYTKNWLFGYKSSFQFYLYPLEIIELFNWAYRRNRIRCAGVIAVVILEAFLCGNTMLLVVSILTASCVLFGVTTNTYICNPWNYGITTIILNWFFLTFQFRNPPFSALISTYFHKNADLAGRVTIWERTYLAIAGHQVFGNGMVSPEIRKSMYQGIVHCHNAVLEMIYEGGIIWAVLFVIIVIYIFHNIYMNIEIESARVYGICIFGILLIGTIEVITHRLDAFIWVLLLTACDPTYIDNCYYKENERFELAEKEE